MKLIVLSPFVYYPGVPNGGGALCWGQLLELARDNEIHYLSFASPDRDGLAQAKSHLLSVCKTVTTVDQHLGRLQVLRSKLRLFTHMTPVVASLCYSSEMQRALQDLINKVQPDAVFIQFPQMAQYVADCQSVATVMDVQDAFSVSAYRSYKAARGWIKKCMALLTWQAWINYETHWYPQFSVTAALTSQDASGLEIFSPGLGASVSTAAVSVPALSRSLPAGKTMAFIGSYAHLPNVAAVLFFVQEVLPLVLAEVPDAVFLVAGKGVTAQMQALAGAHVQFVGMVPDAHAFLGSAAVVVVPLLSGGGIKIKTLEAMAAGCPIVSTSIGAEETGAVSGTHLLVADTPQKFAQHVVQLLQDPASAQRLGVQARALAQAQFSWESKRESLNLQIATAVARHRSRTQLK